MDLTSITPIVITYNEEANIKRTLDSLIWARRVVVVDSYSTDATRIICNTYANVEVIENNFECFSQQCNYALNYVTTKWVLSLDADYIITESLLKEIGNIGERQQSSGYRVNFLFCVFGKPLRRDNTSARTVLYQRQLAYYVEDGHQHRVIINGDVSRLHKPILHDDRKPLSRWLSSQNRYLNIEAKKIHSTSFNKLDTTDKIRKLIIPGPIIIFAYCLFYQLQVLEGWRGWHYTFQRTMVEMLLAIKLIELKVVGGTD